jgi:GT2 family glycosyltransferase
VLLQAAAHHAEVVLVDNASSDGSVELLAGEFPEVRVVLNDRNEGFAGGANVGVKAAASNTVLLLNNDAVPQGRWLEGLLRALEPDDVAIAASVIEETRFPAAYALGTGTISVIGHPVPNILPDVNSPFYATGTALAFKRNLFPEPFEPLFFAYYEDLLLSWRARLRGYRVVRALESRVSHLGGATARRKPDRMAYYWERNKLLTLLLCYEQTTLLRLLPLYLFDGIAHLIEDTVLMASRQPIRHAGWAGLIRHYATALRALLWLAAHSRLVGRLRAVLQSERIVSDSAITPLLSGRIFDDHVPTLGHTVANALSVLYCRIAGIRTAEQ